MFTEYRPITPAQRPIVERLKQQYTAAADRYTRYDDGTKEEQQCLKTMDNVGEKLSKYGIVP